MFNSLLRKYLWNRGRRRASNFIANYTKSLYPNFDFSKKREGEEDHIKLWKGLLLPVNPLWYRLYSELSGVHDMRYIPDDIYTNIVLPLLNNQPLGLAYSEKNFYDLFYRSNLFPKCIVRNIDGIFLNNRYDLIDFSDEKISSLFEGNEKVIVKPTIDSTGGKNVEIFYRAYNNDWLSSDGNKLTKEYLFFKYKTNYVIQEIIEQHPQLSKFNISSLNTLRVLTYRSILDEKIKIVSSVLRVGASGSNVDNLNNGGFIVKVNNNGKLDDFSINKKGIKTNKLNDQLLTNENYIPKFDECLMLAKEVAKKNIHHRLLGLDISIDKYNCVKIIEINNGHIGSDLPHLVGLPLLNDFTEEVIGYCKKNTFKLNKKYTISI